MESGYEGDEIGRRRRCTNQTEASANQTDTSSLVRFAAGRSSSGVMGYVDRN